VTALAVEKLSQSIAKSLSEQLTLKRNLKPDDIKRVVLSCITDASPEVVIGEERNEGTPALQSPSCSIFSACSDNTDQPLVVATSHAANAKGSADTWQTNPVAAVDDLFLLDTLEPWWPCENASEADSTYGSEKISRSVDSISVCTAEVNPSPRYTCISDAHDWGQNDSGEWADPTPFSLDNFLSFHTKYDWVYSFDARHPVPRAVP
jgi:hypothetical protein